MNPLKIKNVIIDLEKVSLVKVDDLQGARAPFVLRLVVDGSSEVIFFEDEDERNNFTKLVIEGACYPAIVDFDRTTL